MSLDYESYSDEKLKTIREECLKEWLKPTFPWYFYPLVIIGLLGGVGGLSMLMSRATNLEQVIVIAGFVSLFAVYQIQKKIRSAREMHHTMYLEADKELKKRKKDG